MAPRTSYPEWFTRMDSFTHSTMSRTAKAIGARRSDLPLPVRHLPEFAHWFILDSMLFANHANKEGSHAVALALTRQCLEALSVIELGLSRHPGAMNELAQWEDDRRQPGQLRKWLAGNVWAGYGGGLWGEPWVDFMGQLVGAVQPYAHYSGMLAQWQFRLHSFTKGKDGASTGTIELAPRAYDAQKATRITLFHALLTFAIARVWVAHEGNADMEFAREVTSYGEAIGRSKYLDGKGTDWKQQFWAMVWSVDSGTPILE